MVIIMKKRLDVLMTEQGLSDSREKAKAVIMAGQVYVNGQKIDKAGASFADDCSIEVRGSTLKYVSRGGLKLERALDYFGGDPAGKVCLDCGASTGGFTDCLLGRGAKKVYAIDVGYGQLAWSIRNDPRVVVMERTNIRNVTPDMLEERPEIATIDVSFISLALVLPVLKELLTPDGEVFCLIKPQFEAGREKVGKKGVVRDEETHREVVESFIKNAESSGFGVRGITFSPVKGPEGNIEFLGNLLLGAESVETDTDAVVRSAHEELS